MKESHPRGPLLSRLMGALTGAPHPEQVAKNPKRKPKRRPPLQVVDEEGVRKLYFDRRFIQSAMRIADPYALELVYTRYMMSFLLFTPEPKEILLIGLGGGSLAKFCHRHLPETQITVVECEAEVIALRDRFLIPDDERLQIVHADAAEYLPVSDKVFDVILLDGFDAEGIAPSLATPAFYRSAVERLTPSGVLVTNLVGETKVWHSHLQLLWRAFKRRVRVTAIPGEDEHYIGLAFNDPEAYRLPPTMDEVGAGLDARIPVDLPRLASWLRKEHGAA